MHSFVQNGSAMSGYCTLLSKVDVPTKYCMTTCSSNKRDLGIVVNIHLAAEIKWPVKNRFGGTELYLIPEQNSLKGQ